MSLQKHTAFGGVAVAMTATEERRDTGNEEHKGL